MTTQFTSAFPDKRWYALDNAAKIYPAVRTARWHPIFRLSATLHEEVDPVRLQAALAAVLPRFPHIKSRLRRGLFWYYIEDNAGMPCVQEDVRNPCMVIREKENGYFHFRVRYYQRRIAVEFLHSLTDGGGGMVFLKTLTAQYLALGGHPIPAGDGVLDCARGATPEELEDSYKKHADLSAVRSRRERRAWHVPGARESAGVMHLTTGVIPTEALRAAARERGVSVTELLVAVQLYALHRVQREMTPAARRAVKVSVPVDMRRFYPSKTLRNFSLFINVGVEPGLGEYSFDEITKHVHHTLRRDVNTKYLNSMMAMNVSSENNPLLRGVPLFVKKASLIMAYQILGEQQFTMSFSNLGATTVPEAMRPLVERFDMILGPPRTNRLAAAVVSYGGVTTVNFTRDMPQPQVERIFFTQLVKIGLPVRVESNEMGASHHG